MRFTRNFATASDGTLIYYEVGGEGPCVSLVNSVGASASFWKYLSPSLRKNFTVIFWDMRGHGESDFPHALDKLDVAALADDLSCVLDACGVESTAIVGHSTGFQVALEFYKFRPARVKGIVDISGSFERPLTNFLRTRHAATLAALIAKVGTTLHGIAELAAGFALTSPLFFEFIRYIFLNPQFAKREDFEPFLAHLSRMDYEFLARLLRTFEEHSGRAVLEELDVPLLVVAGEADPFTPTEHYEEICELAPDCDIFWLRRGSHAALLEQPEVVNLRVEKFLQERVEF